MAGIALAARLHRGQQFTGFALGIDLDFGELYFRFAVVGLARVGPEGFGPIAYVLGFIDAVRLGYRPAHGLVLGKGCQGGGGVRNH